MFELRKIMLWEAHEAEKALTRARERSEYVGHAERRLALALSRLRELGVEQREWDGMLKTLRDR